MEANLFLSVSVLTVTCILLFFHPHSILPLNHGNTEAAGAPYYTTGDVSINCGSKWNSTALDGREWTGESASASISGQSTSSVVAAASFLGADPVPYITSRISSSPFHFSFRVSPGQKFIRLHFYPALYRGYEKSLDLFTVKAGPFVLLSEFSPTHASPVSKFLVKEFCLNVEQHGKLRITFSPSKSHMAYAFVNGIEIVSMPTSLYYTPDGDAGAPIVGQSNRYYGIDNRTALEMVQRLNVEGSFTSSVEDVRMFRRWSTSDAAYFLKCSAPVVNYGDPQQAAYINTNLPLLTAPPNTFPTSWKTTTHQLNSFTWKIPITLGFGYLVRLHFCDLDAATREGERKEFSILIDGQIAETHADVMRWSGGTGFPAYKDYVVMMKRDKEGSQCDLFIVLQSLNGISVGLLKGIEIFRLSNWENSLATSSSSPAFLKKVSPNWNLTVRRRFFSLFSQSNVIGTGILVMISIVNTAVYYLRLIWEENSQNNVEPSNYRRFSLADIKFATQNFSNAFLIGRGGFGRVYKGFINGFPDTVAIKRLGSFSRQGAREFRAEIEILSKLRHPHLVSLIGYCDEDGQMILTYEYISGGTLAENLYEFARKGKALLSWEDRLRICIGAARGLEYLHTGSETGAIIHRDVKDSNILLGDNLVAKISDFGLSKLEEPTQLESCICTNPEYWSTGRSTIKSDVYSFGIVMLNVLSGRRTAWNSVNPGESELLTCFKECLWREQYGSIVDANICNNISPASLRKFVSGVESCVQINPQDRPTMTQLVSSLEEALQLQQEPIVQHFEREMIQGPVSVSLPRKEVRRNTAFNVISRIFQIQYWKISPSRENPILDVGEKLEDAVFGRLLPADYRDILIRSPDGLRLLKTYRSKKELYRHLCHNPLLIDDGTKSFTLDKVSGKKRFMLGGRALAIVWSNTPQYWKFISFPESRFDSVAELVNVCWLDIRGVINSKMLSPNTKYAVYLVFTVRSWSYGFEQAPLEVSVGFSGQERKTQSFYLDHGGHGSRGQSSEVGCLTWRRHDHTWTSRQRSDGWLEIELGEIHIKKNMNADIEMRLAEVKRKNWKRGIVIEGIEFRAK